LPAIGHEVALSAKSDPWTYRNAFRTANIRMMFDAPASKWFIVPAQALSRAL
jgi:hypothetical protein